MFEYIHIYIFYQNFCHKMKATKSIKLENHNESSHECK